MQPAAPIEFGMPAESFLQPELVAAVCVMHNWFGKAYLPFIVPFHRLGVKYILSRALRDGRL